MSVVFSFGTVGWLIAFCVFQFYVLIFTVSQVILARLFALPVETVSLGFGPRLFGFWKGEHTTDWRLSLIPFGGYAKFAEEFTRAPRPSKMVVALAGPLADLTVGLLAIAYSRSFINEFSPLIEVLGNLGLVLALANLLPVPIFSGGAVLLLFVEMLLGRDLSLSVKETYMKVGFVLSILVWILGIRWLLRT